MSRPAGHGCRAIGARFAYVLMCIAARAERPGLVLGLDRGGSCVGLAFRVPDGLRDEVVTYLRERELVTSVYLERLLPVRLANGSSVTAVTYIVDRRHEQYAGSLGVGEAARIVSSARGVSGENTDYVRNTLAHLTALGLRDPWLADVVASMHQD